MTDARDQQRTQRRPATVAGLLRALGAMPVAVACCVGLSAIAGCGSDNAVDVPRDPAPVPKVEPQTAGTSLPADPR